MGRTTANDVYGRWDVAIGITLVSTGFAALCGWLGGGQELWGFPALLLLAMLCMAIQWLVYIPSYLRRTEHYYDLTGSLTYMTLVAGALAVGTQVAALQPRQLLVGGLVLLWAGRLGSFLFFRVRRVGKDERFDTMKQSAPRFLIAWSLQGLWVFLTSLGALILLVTPSVYPLGILDLTGFSLWALGFGIEVVADQQKKRFRSKPKGADKWIDTGLWAWSRHPNYFGEILLWTGVAVIGCGVFSGGQWIGLISPLFVIWLLTQISGVPLLEARADKRWGHDPAYQAYKRDTPVLIPRVPRSDR